MREFASCTTVMMLTALMVVVAAPLSAQEFDYSDIDIEVRITESRIPQGGSSTLIIRIEVPYGFSLSAMDGVFDIVPLNEIEGVTFGDLQNPPPDKVDEVGGHYLGETIFRLPFTIADIPPGEREIILGFMLQICDEESGMCMFPSDPEDIQRSVKFEIVGVEKEAPAQQPSADRGSVA
ncbi:MAG TPA: hypothetical protein VMX35_10450 [Acidobacteriota bacterium]|nr:hypothetical protein [Acidobacteriota bacterium]